MFPYRNKTMYYSFLMSKFKWTHFLKGISLSTPLLLHNWTHIKTVPDKTTTYLSLLLMTFHFWENEEWHNGLCFCGGCPQLWAPQLRHNSEDQKLEPGHPEVPGKRTSVSSQSWQGKVLSFPPCGCPKQKFCSHPAKEIVGSRGVPLHYQVTIVPTTLLFSYSSCRHSRPMQNV